jgi:hypothetical protein
MTVDRQRYVLWPGVQLAKEGVIGRRLLLDKLRLIEEYRTFEGEIPDDFYPDEVCPGAWSVRGGAIQGVAAPASPALLWHRRTLPRDCAVRLKAAVYPTVDRPIRDASLMGEINLFWHGTGKACVDGFRSMVGSLGGFYDGFCGIEYLEGAEAESKACALSRPVELALQRPYEILAGHLDGTDFFFVDGLAACQVANHHELPPGQVALSTFGDEGVEACVRFWDIAFFEITPAAIERLLPAEGRAYKAPLGRS